MEIFALVLEAFLADVSHFAILFFELGGVCIIICSGVRSFARYLRRMPGTRIHLARGLAMGLEFKLGSEILRTVVVREWTEIAVVGGIIALRAALTLLIHWEIRQDET